MFNFRGPFGYNKIFLRIKDTGNIQTSKVRMDTLCNLCLENDGIFMRSVCYGSTIHRWIFRTSCKQIIRTIYKVSYKHVDSGGMKVECATISNGSPQEAVLARTTLNPSLLPAELIEAAGLDRKSYAFYSPSLSTRVDLTPGTQRASQLAVP